MKIKMIVIGLLLCGSAFAENCRLVRGESEAGRIAVSFGCLAGETLRVSGTCYDSESFTPYVLRKVASNRVICLSPSYAVRPRVNDDTSGYLCSDDQFDISCLPAIKLTYECCF